MKEKQVFSGLYGLFVADAVGVPAEFQNRAMLKRKPVTDMMGGGVHGQSVGTWSDDSSMALCLLVSLTEQGAFDATDIMERFTKWLDGDYTPHGRCFDCGIACIKAISRFQHGTPAAECGGTGINSNGNGSLMRILPLVYPLYDQYGADLTASNHAMELIHLVSGLTHRHEIAMSACGIYLNIAARLLNGMPLNEAILSGVTASLKWYGKQTDGRKWVSAWDRISSAEDLKHLPEDEINSGGYVVDSLEASLWCLLNTDNYRDCVLKAVNLGRDTDTTAAIAGGLAGLAYGIEGIPEHWVRQMVKKDRLDAWFSAFANADIQL